MQVDVRIHGSLVDAADESPARLSPVEGQVEDAATTNEGVVVTFFTVLALYLAVGVTTILVLRAMKRRFERREQAEDGFAEDDVPYGPSAPASLASSSEEGEG